jgi:cell volume regulation protein A
LTLSIEQLLLGAAVLLLVSVFSSKISSSIGVPALLLFLFVGMLAGSEGPGGIPFDNADLAQSLGVIALVVILYSGGLNTDWRSLQPVLRDGMILATAGVALTAGAVGLFLHLVLGFDFLPSLLIGAIVSSTDAAAVFAILRSRGVRLQGRLERLLELESGSNDPLAIVLTLSIIQLITLPDVSLISVLVFLVQQFAIGGIGGYLIGRLTVYLINRARLDYDGLYSVLTVGLMLLAYGAVTTIGGNGFLAVYLAALLIGREDFIHKRSLLRFHDGLAWIMQIVMFLTLGLLVFPSQVIATAGIGLLVSAFLIFVARPFSVTLTLALSGMPFRYIALISWVGLRGAAPIVLATFPLLAGVPDADAIFNIVFIVVLTSVALQGTTIIPIAKWLGVQANGAASKRPPLEMVVTDATTKDIVELTIPPHSSVVGRQLVDLHLPDETLIILVARGNDSFVPRGDTILAAGDLLMILAQRKCLPRVRDIFETEVVPAE